MLGYVIWSGIGGHLRKVARQGSKSSSNALLWDILVQRNPRQYVIHPSLVGRWKAYENVNNTSLASPPWQIGRAMVYLLVSNEQPNTLNDPR
jgi:hypothetical protein